MYNVCMRIVNHVGEAEDILQESFIDAFRNLDGFKGNSSFGAWLKRIVVNKSLNYLKKRKVEIVNEDALIDDVPDTTEADEYDIKHVVNLIQQLPDGYRVVLTLYLVEEYSHAEIATMLNISESTSKTQYMRAKARIKEQLLKQRV
jgi:RNA polymerase sigma factor (sigma-70 family)